MNEWEKNQANENVTETEAAAVEHNETATDGVAQDRQLPQTAAVKSGMPAWPWILVSVIAIAGLIFVLLRDQSTAGAMNNAVAEMDGATLTKSDLYDAMVQQTPAQQLGQMVGKLSENKLIGLEADKAGVTVADADLQKEIDKIKTRLGADQFNQALQQYGMTLDTLKEQIKPELQLRGIFEKQNPVKEADLKAYYDKNKEMFATTPKEVKASHILVSTKEEADAILAQLKAGKDFAALAKEKSTDTGTKDKGGDLGFFGRGKMDPQFEQAAFELKKGQLSDVVQSQFGFHIIKVTDIKEPVIPSYEEKKDDVKQAYLDEQVQTKREEWLNKVKKDRNYQNLLEKKAEPAATPAPTAKATEQGK